MLCSDHLEPQKLVTSVCGPIAEPECIALKHVKDTEPHGNRSRLNRLTLYDDFGLDFKRIAANTRQAPHALASENQIVAARIAESR